MTKNINPNYSIFPGFAEKNPKTTLKICVISKQSLWFLLQVPSVLPILLKKKKSTKKELHVSFSFLLFISRTLLFTTIPSHIIMIQSKKFKIQTNKIP